MLFPTVDFALFFCLVFLGHWVLNHNARAWKWFMIGASYVFYGWWNPAYIALLAVSIVFNYGMGIAIVSTNQGLLTDREARERRVGGEILCQVW